MRRASGVAARRRLALPSLAAAGTWLAAAGFGSASVLGFAPFRWWWMPLLTVAGLAWLVERSASAWRAAGVGFAFGLGYFLTGTSWVFVSMHRYGGMSVPLAGFATLFFCTYLALFPAAASGLAGLARGEARRLVLVFPAAWALAEWVRGWMFTGFPWLALGYAQAPQGPLASLAPVTGVYGISLASALGASALVWWAPWRRWREGVRAMLLHPGIAILAALSVCAATLRPVAWTTPVGEPVAVSLIQGNIEQDMKWRPEWMRASLETYLQLVGQSRGRLILLPETALPMLDVQVPAEYFAALRMHAQDRGGDLLLGVPEYLPADPARPGDEGRYYNSVKSFGTSATQTYRKHHLVPFGDYFPQWFFVTWVMQAIDVPMSSFSRGDALQQPLAVAGQRVAANICYEDVFGEEIIRQLPAATLLANFTNDAWWGDSAASEQHLQMAQMRAQETGRYMLRATNTGVTAIIDQRGRILRSAPEFVATIVEGEAQGYAGSTPYVRWGNWPFLALALAMLGVLVGGAGANPTPRTATGREPRE
jgi:apolipoprotein N-acyltransferase